MIEISSTSAHFDALKDVAEGLNARLEAELRKANRDIGAVVTADSKELLQEEIDNVPIPLRRSANKKLTPGAKIRTKTTKGSHGQWSRTGNLKRSQTFRVESDGLSVTVANTANYAAARAALGGPNPPNAKGRRAGSQRDQSHLDPAERSQTKAVGNWIVRVVRRREGWIRDRYQAAIARALEARP